MESNMNKIVENMKSLRGDLKKEQFRYTKGSDNFKIIDILLKGLKGAILYSDRIKVDIDVKKTSMDELTKEELLDVAKSYDSYVAVSKGLKTNKILTIVEYMNSDIYTPNSTKFIKDIIDEEFKPFVVKKVPNCNMPTDYPRADITREILSNILKSISIENYRGLFTDSSIISLLTEIENDLAIQPRLTFNYIKNRKEQQTKDKLNGIYLDEQVLDKVEKGLKSTNNVFNIDQLIRRNISKMANENLDRRMLQCVENETVNGIQEEYTELDRKALCNKMMRDFSENSKNINPTTVPFQEDTNIKECVSIDKASDIGDIAVILLKNLGEPGYCVTKRTEYSSGCKETPINKTE